MDQNAKQLAVERLKNSANILVTVSSNPQVDDLSALIGFALLLSKLNKHASAVFSGQVPPAIDFLQPNARLEKDVASLRDFIIALDKSKADKLRYKVEDNVVKIFITPYKSRISQDDLTFSEGDFNVDTVVALGVSKRDDLDNAIKSHGRILHDAAVITVNAGAKTSDLGSVDWQDPAASSLCEMLVSISEAFGSGLLDEQISTAFLTGIVSATDRFSNNKTSPKVMTMAAQLMAAGANQQLITNNLEVAGPSSLPPVPVEEDGSQLSINHDEQPSPQADVELPLPQPATSQDEAPQAEVAEPAKTENPTDTTPPIIKQPTSTPLPQPSDLSPPSSKPAPPEKSIKEMEEEIAKMASSAKAKKKELLPPRLEPKPPDEEEIDNKVPKIGLIGQSKGHGPRDIDENPTMGGTFNATSEQAHEESVSDLRNSVNSTLLSHPTEPLDEEKEPADERPESKANDLAPITMGPTLPDEPAAAITPEPPKDTGEINVDEARKAVEDAMNSQAFSPANNPLQSINAQPLPDTGGTGSQEISIDPSGNLQSPGQSITPPPGDNNQEFKLPS